jgi:hypothetical protein
VAVTYRIDQVAPDQARDDLMRLWGDNLTVDGGVERKFDWLYVDAPDRPDRVFMLAARAAGADRWIGTAAVLVRRLSVLGVDRPVGLAADLAVDRGHRTVLPALSLVRAARDWAIGALDLVYGFPNQLAAGVFKRVGFRPLGTIGRWARVLRHGAYAERIAGAELPRVPPALRRAIDAAAGVPAIAAVAGGAVDLARLAKLAPATADAARRHRLTWLAAADERFDALWAAARGDFDVVGVRTSRFLRWRFPASERLAIALSTARAGGAPAAYAVVETVDGIAHMRDVFGRREAIGPLLDRLVPALYARGAHAISVRYLGAPWLIDLIEARGFVARTSDRAIMIDVRAELPAAEREAVTTAARWHLTDADEDT